MASYDEYLDQLMVQCRQSMPYPNPYPHYVPSHQPTNTLPQGRWRCAPRGQYNSDRRQPAIGAGSPIRGYFRPSILPQRPNSSERPNPPPTLSHPEVSHDTPNEPASAPPEPSPSDTRSAAIEQEGTLGTAPVKTEDAPVKTEDALVKTEDAPIKTEDAPSKGVREATPETQPIQPQRRWRGKALNAHEHEVLTRCCLNNGSFCKRGVMASFWNIVQMDFQVETGRQYSSAREMMSRLLHPIQLELAQKKRYGRIRHPKVADHLRPLLVDCQKLIDSAKDIVGPHAAADLSFGPHAESAVSPDARRGSFHGPSFDEDAQEGQRKRKVTEWIEDTADATATVERPHKRRAVAETLSVNANRITRHSSDYPVEDGAISRPSCLSTPSPVQQPPDDTDSLLSSVNEDDTDSLLSSVNEDDMDSLSSADEDDTDSLSSPTNSDSDNSSGDSSGDPSEDSSKRRTSARARLGQQRSQRQLYAELSKLKRSVVRLTDSTANMMGRIKVDDRNIWRTTSHVVAKLATSLAAYAGLKDLETIIRRRGNIQSQHTEETIDTLKGLVATDKTLRDIGV